LGFDLWLKNDFTSKTEDDISKHSIFAIKERMQQAYTKAIKKGMSTKDIADKLGMSEDEVKVVFTYFDQLDRFEKKLNVL
jgi:DNA-binding NarL/FixJ family response regulator